MSDLKRKIMIKTRVLIVLIALLISVFSFASVYANAVSFELKPSKTVVKRGEKVTIIAKTIDINQLNGGFNGYSGTLGYDSSVLSRSESKTAISGWTIAYNAANNKFVGSDPTGMDFKTSDLDVIAFEFTVLESAPTGKTTVKLSDLKLSDKNYKAVNAGNTSVELIIEDNQKPTEPTKSSNSKLKTLKPSIGALNQTFDPNKTSYTIDVDENTDSISFSGTLEDSKGKIISGLTDHTLSVGKNEIKIVVEAEDGTKTVYTVIVNKPKKNEDDSSGGNGSDNNGSGGNGSDNNGSGGNGSDNNGSDNNGSGGNGSGGNSDNDTNNSNTNTNTNTNTNNQNTNIKIDSGSSNNYVIKVEGLGNIVEGFNPQSNTHTSYVGKETENLNPVITLEDKDASYEIIGADNLKIGNNPVKLIVTAANGDKREYNFNVIRSNEENTSKLSSLSVGGNALNPGFRPDVNYYTMIVDNDTHALGVSAAPMHGGAVVNISGNDHLKTGVNLIKVTVDSNYQQNTYMVEVIKEAEVQGFNFLPWIISALAIILAIALLIVLHYKNKMLIMKDDKSTRYDLVLLQLLNQNNRNVNEINHQRGGQNE